MSKRTSTYTPTVMAALVIFPILAAAQGDANPLDGILRGQWVRAVMTEKGEHTAVLCLPSKSMGEIDKYRAQLPQAFVDLKTAGVKAVGIDISLVGEHEADLSSAAAAARLPVAWSRSYVAGSYRNLPKPMSVLIERSGDLSINPQRAAHGRMYTAPIPEMVLGTELSLGTEETVLWPLSLEVLTLYEGEGPPRWHGTSLVVGGTVFEQEADYLPFMPYKIPLLSWDRREDWAAIAQGRMVFIGACKADRDLTRFGRQPGAVAHAELVETVMDRVFPLQVPAWLDVIATICVGAAAFGMRRTVPQFRLIGPLFIGAVALCVSLAAALTGLWAGFTGIVLAAIFYGIAAEQEEAERAGPLIYTMEDPPEPEANDPRNPYLPQSPEPEEGFEEYEYDNFSQDYVYEYDDDDDETF